MSAKPLAFLDDLRAQLYNLGEHFKAQAADGNSEPHVDAPPASARPDIVLDDGVRNFHDQLVRDTREPTVGPPSRTLFSSPSEQRPDVLYSVPRPPPGPCRQARERQRRCVVPRDVLSHIASRSVSARVKFGAEAVLDTRKGLSRVLDASSREDIEEFGDELRNSDVRAVEDDWEREDKLPIFALSYVQKNPAQGRFKFDDEQWECLQEIVTEVADSGVRQFRFWLDQCLWLRDSSQNSWAEIGLLPYVMWPVVCLNVKEFGGERSVICCERVWPFLEEVGGLWGRGRRGGEGR